MCYKVHLWLLGYVLAQKHQTCPGQGEFVPAFAGQCRGWTGEVRQVRVEWWQFWVGGRLGKAVREVDWDQEEGGTSLGDLGRFLTPTPGLTGITWAAQIYTQIRVAL